MNGLSVYSNINGLSVYSNIHGLSVYSNINGLSVYSNMNGLSGTVVIDYYVVVSQTSQQKSLIFCSLDFYFYPATLTKEDHYCSFLFACLADIDHQRWVCS